jgi:hypothetical protein
METRLRPEFEESQAAAARAADLLRPVEATITMAVATASRIERQVGEIAQLIESATALDHSIDDLKVPLPQELYATRTGARERLGLARERVVSGQRSQNAAVLDEAVKYAQSASAALNDVLDRVRRLARSGFEQRFGDAVKAAQELFAFVEASMASLERLQREQPSARLDMPERRDAIRREVEAQRRRFDRARTSEDLAAIDRVVTGITQQRGALDELLKSFGPISLRDRGVVQALEEGARLFFQGDYRGALAALDPPGGLADIPLQLHVHLLRAGASYALWVLSGGTDQVLRGIALKEVETCKRLNSAFRPDPRTFSPAFISFYQEAGSAPQASAPNSPAR